MSGASMDPRTPVLVGLGELLRRPAELDAADLSEPADMMAAAVRLAAEDSGATSRDALLSKVGALAAVPPAAWPDGDPGRRVGALLGIASPTLRSSLQGGNGPQLLLNLLCTRIAAGSLDAGVVCGAEALQSVVQAGKRGIDLGWPAPDASAEPDELVEGERAPSTEAEVAAGVLAPIMAYPLIENAFRAASGRTVADHLGVVSELWSRFSAVAAEQPCAWTPKRYPPEELATESAGNRKVTFPYLKLHNSNIQVDQAAAVIVCSAAVAEELGVPRDRWVFPHAGAQAADEWMLSHRRELHRSPAIAACGRAAFAHAGVGPDDLTHVDLYSCFPSAVQLAADALGLPLDRKLTMTGGLTFFGGPGNNYATHGVVAVARALRASEPGTYGLSTALGWYATKHALGVYGSSAPERPFAAFDADPELPEPRESVPAASVAGSEAVAETCTVIYERDGSGSYGILFALLDDGRRALAQTRDAQVMEAMTGDGFLGSRVRLDAEGGFVL